MTKEDPKWELEDSEKKFRFGSTPQDDVLVQLGVMLQENEAWIPLAKAVIEIVEIEARARQRAKIIWEQIGSD